MSARKPWAWLAPGVWLGAALPVVRMAVDASAGELGANPVSRALNRLGLLALVALVATLACTPAQQALGWTWPPRIRRALGVWTFLYASLHLGLYVAVDQGLKFGSLWDDVLKRPFVTVGFLSWLCMVPLAVTSTPDSIRRLGFVAWKRLHRLTFVAAALALVHFVWKVKKDLSEPLVYVALVAVLVAVRVTAVLKKRQRPVAR